MQYKNEKQILNLIKYIPSLFILLIGILITIFLYIEKTNSFESDKQNLQNEYIDNNKKAIKNRVDRAYSFVNRTMNKTEEELKQSLKKEVEQAYEIILNIYNQNQDKSKIEIIKMVKNALRKIRFNNGRGYLFIYTMDGVNILNAAFPNIEGRNLWNYQDLKGTYLIQEMKKILKIKDSTYYDWYWNKPNDKEKVQYKKIGYFKKIEELNWFIGTGEYIDDFEKEMKNKILRHFNELRYDKTNYLYIVDFQGNFLAHINKEFIGKDISYFKNTPRFNIVESIIDTAKKGEAYLQYPGVFNHLRKTISPKTVFVKGVEDLGWALGTGFYKDELEILLEKRKNEYDKKYKSYISDMLIICIILTILLLILSKYISNVLEKKFIAYQEEIKRHLEDNTRQHNIFAQQSKMAAMGEMIGNIAHQWRQPLSTIMTAATGMQLQKEVNLLNDKTFNDTIFRITESVSYLSKTIDDFRNFFKQDKEFEIASTNDVIQKSLRLVHAQFETNNIDIIQDIENIKFLTLENELIQVILNILNNSRDELLRIEDKDYRKLVFINISKIENKIFIKIKDNGGGISNNIIDRIFEPYFTTKHKAQGTGIGLYMSREIIEKHLNGKILVSNEKFTYEEVSYYGAEFIIIFDINN